MTSKNQQSWQGDEGFAARRADLEPEDQLDGGAPRDDALTGVVDEQEVQNSQQSHERWGGDEATQMHTSETLLRIPTGR